MRKLPMRLDFPALTGRRHGGLTVIEIMVVVAIIGVLTAVAIPQYTKYREDGRKRQAVLDIQQIGFHLDRYRTEFGELPIALTAAVDPVPSDPWGNPYEYLNLEAGLPGTKGRRRRDKNMNPINSDYDLYSRGPDGESQAQLVASKARDDIVRAADGDFVGVAEDF
jgi:general secretion pathway protein G